METDRVEVDKSAWKKVIKVWNSAAERICRRQRLKAARTNRKSKYKLFIVGDLVIIKVPHPQKLSERYVGPFLVIEKRESQLAMYLIQSLTIPYTRQLVNAKRLKLYYDPI